MLKLILFCLISLVAACHAEDQNKIVLCYNEVLKCRETAKKCTHLNIGKLSFQTTPHLTVSHNITAIKQEYPHLKLYAEGLVRFAIVSEAKDSIKQMATELQEHGLDGVAITITSGTWLDRDGILADFFKTLNSEMNKIKAFVGVLLVMTQISFYLGNVFVFVDFVVLYHGSDYQHISPDFALQSANNETKSAVKDMKTLLSFHVPYDKLIIAVSFTNSLHEFDPSLDVNYLVGEKGTPINNKDIWNNFHDLGVVLKYEEKTQINYAVVNNHVLLYDDTNTVRRKTMAILNMGIKGFFLNAKDACENQRVGGLVTELFKTVSRFETIKNPDIKLLLTEKPAKFFYNRMRD